LEKRIHCVGDANPALADRTGIMNFIKWWTGRFTVRGKAMANVRKGIECAKSHDSENAVKLYSETIHARETPSDIKASALFNRALVYASTGNEPKAKEDLNQILAMKDDLPDLKSAARQRLVRLQRKTSGSGNS
jgi:tetratricopeptide (TPR) repeat protein